MSLQTRCKFIFYRNVQLSILALIILNAASLGVETIRDLSPDTRNLLENFDTFCLYVYVVELALKHIASGFKFWKDGWNIFDFTIVAFSFIPAGSSLSILRGLRILRVLRLLSTIRPLKRIVVGLLKSIPGIGWLSLLVMINFYLFAVIGTNFFGDKFPEFFGSIGASSFTLFQIMTLESWSMGIARPVIAEYQYAYIFFVVFILINTFVMLNLFVGIIVNAMSSIDNDIAEENKEQQSQKTDTEESDRDNIKSLSEQIAVLKRQLAIAADTVAKLETKIKAEQKNNSL